MTHRRLMRSCAATLAIGLLAACGTVAPAPATGTAPALAPSAAPTRTATPVDPPVTLRFADAEGQGTSSQPWIDRFIEAVGDRSNGSITIEPLYRVGGGNVNSPGESIVAGMVMGGEVELALVPVRAWSDVGIKSLNVLAAPLLIDSDELLTAVAADALVQPLLDDMLNHGLIGLSAWPDDLRHPFAWEENGPPFLTAADLDGAKFWALESGLQASILEAMGAVPVSSTIAELDAMVADGSLRGVESSFNAIGSLSGKPTATGDVVLYPKYQILVAEDAAFSRLTAQQQQAVRDAAIAARDVAISDHVADAKTAREWCEQGGRVVLAGEDNVETFREAAQPILDGHSADPLATAAIAAIRALKANTTATPVEACEPAADPNAPWPSIPPGPELDPIPDGVYVHSVTRDGLEAAGVTQLDARNNAGKWTLTVSRDHGSFFLQHDPRDVGPDESFRLEIVMKGDRIRLQAPTTLDFWDVRWRPEGDDIYLEVVDSNWSSAQADITLNAYFRGTWTKVE